MLLYHSSRWTLQEGRFDPCMGPLTEEEGHAWFASEPVPGIGPWLYVVELPEAEAARFEREVPHQPEGIRRFLLPPEKLGRARAYEFETLTGRPWNEFYVVLKDPAADRVTQPWSRIWASRTEAAEIQEYMDHPEAVLLSLTEHFKVEEDYVIQETQEFGGRKWALTLLAGTPPMWADFPHQWQRWVNHPAIQESAQDYIRTLVPEVARDVAHAARQTHKVAVAAAWQKVADKVGARLARTGGLGTIPAGSWTSILAMPIRIAQRIGGWEPPRAKPEFQNPETSGRVLLAAPGEEVPGTFPKVDPRREGRGIPARTFPLNLTLAQPA